MEKQYQYLLGGFVILLFIVIQFGFSHIGGSPYLLSYPLALISLALIITGVFETTKYYNKSMYLITMFLVLIITLITTYLNSPISDLNRIIMAELLITLAFLLGYDFIQHINKSESIDK